MSKKVWVSASDVGKTDYCPHSVSLKAQKAPINRQSKMAMREGDNAHARVNAVAAAQDKRCYIASYLYGIDDPRTECLRQFRDKHLMPHAGGRVLVEAYYRLSPWLVDLSKQHSVVNRLLSGLTRMVVRWLEH